MLLFTASAVIFYSCEKEYIDDSIEQKDVTIGTFTEVVKFYQNGNKLIEESELLITETTSLIVVNPKIVYVFDNDEDLLTWGTTRDLCSEITSVKNEVMEKHLAIEKFRSEVKVRGIVDNEEALQALYNEMFAYKNNERGAGILSSEKDGKGSLLPILGTYWRMPRGWDNRASSIVASATTVLCSRTWFRGTRIYVLLHIGINLEDYDFDNQTSSIF